MSVKIVSLQGRVQGTLNMKCILTPKTHKCVISKDGLQQKNRQGKLIFTYLVRAIDESLELLRFCGRHLHYVSYFEECQKKWNLFLFVFQNNSDVITNSCYSLSIRVTEYHPAIFESLVSHISCYFKGPFVADLRCFFRSVFVLFRHRSTTVLTRSVKRMSRTKFTQRRQDQNPYTGNWVTPKSKT